MPQNYFNKRNEGNSIRLPESTQYVFFFISDLLQSIQVFNSSIVFDIGFSFESIFILLKFETKVPEESFAVKIASMNLNVKTIKKQN